MIVELASDQERWDRFVAAQPDASFCHAFAWGEVIRRTFGHECLFLEARDPAGATAGVLPLVRVKTPLFGHFLVSMPFLSYGGPLGSAEAVRALADHAVALADGDGAGLLEFRSRHELPLALPVSHRKVTVVLDLEPGNPEAAFKAFPSKLRSQVRRPQKEGVEVRFGADQLAPFYAVFARHMRDLGTPVLPRRFFEAVSAAFGERAWFAAAWLDGVPVAGGCGFTGGGEFEITWASSLAEYSRVAPNMLLYWAFIERAAQAGLRCFNFGRCTPGAGTHRFKLQWGSREEPLWWYQHARGAAAKTPSPDDAAYAWGPRLWKRLPVPVATALGPWVVRGIP